MQFLVLAAIFLCHVYGFVLDGSSNSYSQFRKWGGGTNGTLEFEFKTDQPNGLLLYTDDGGTYDFFEIKLVEGALRLRYNLGGGAQIITVGKELNDGHWHKVQVQRHEERTILTVDGVSQMRTSRGKEFNFGKFETNSDVYIGGMPKWYNKKLALLALPSVIFEPRFMGSVRNLIYPDVEGGVSRRQETRPKDHRVLRGNSSDACEVRDPCQHGGICISTDSGPICECRNSDYEGEFCEKGGFARIFSILKHYRKLTRKYSICVLYLNAGDTFTGTPWFSLYKTEIAIELMKLLKPEAIALGKHEFDFMPQNISDYIKGLSGLVVAANLDVSKDNILSSIGINASVVLIQDSRKIAIVGYITPRSTTFSNVSFFDEIPAIQQEISILKSQQIIDIVIVLGHSGYEMDKKIAEEVNFVDIVVGGGSHTFLWNGQQPNTETIEGPYPTVVRQRSGKNVLVVQMFCNTKYLGILNLTFNKKGEIIRQSAQPILLDYKVEQDKMILNILDKYRPGIDKLFNETIGLTETALMGDGNICRNQECNFGNLVTDALVAYGIFSSESLFLIGIFTGGGIRSTISSGYISMGDLFIALPFEDQVVSLTLKGSDIARALNQIIRIGTRLPQVSGLVIVVDKTRKHNYQITSVDTRRHIYRTFSYETIQLGQDYRIITSSFLADGGDDATIFKYNGRDQKIYDKTLTEVVSWYIKKRGIVNPKVENRIMIVNNGKCLDASYILMFINLYFSLYII